MPNYTIDRKQLFAEIGQADAQLVAQAKAVVKEKYFDPAVLQLKADFEDSKVTQEIHAGVDAENVSGTLDAPFRDEEGDSTPNLFSFIGFDRGTDPTEAIRERLDPRHQSGPKMIYTGKDKQTLTYNFTIKAPNEQAIYNATPIPWATGLSWAKRIEQGIAGIGQFLNVLNRPASRSGGGIQVGTRSKGAAGTLRSGRFKPTKYLTSIFNDFIASFSQIKR